MFPKSQHEIWWLDQESFSTNYSMNKTKFTLSKDNHAVIESRIFNYVLPFPDPPWEPLLWFLAWIYVEQSSQDIPTLQCHCDILLPQSLHRHRHDRNVNKAAAGKEKLAVAISTSESTNYSTTIPWAIGEALWQSHGTAMEMYVRHMTIS